LHSYVVRPERDYEHWLFESMKNILKIRGFRTAGLFFITQRQEKKLPFDMGLWIKQGDYVKVIGFQVKGSGEVEQTWTKLPKIAQLPLGLHHPPPPLGSSGACHQTQPRLGGPRLPTSLA